MNDVFLNDLYLFSNDDVIVMVNVFPMNEDDGDQRMILLFWMWSFDLNVDLSRIFFV